MGQKVHPKGFRLGYVAPHSAVWYADKKTYAKNLQIDFAIRTYIKKEFSFAYISDVIIERRGEKIFISIKTARPGSLIGKKGEGIEKIKHAILKLAGLVAHVEAVPVKYADSDATLVAANIARQLEKRVMFRRAMKKAIQAAMKNNIQGIKVQVSGRLSGAEIARSEVQKEGTVPLHTLRKKIDYAVEEALTTYGVIGVKVWICHG